jgi:hypothetical protein
MKKVIFAALIAIPGIAVTVLTTNIISLPFDYLRSLFTRPVAVAQNVSSDGRTVIQNGGGGTGADISVTGSQNGSPTIGLDTHGLSVNQTGPGTGMRVIVNGGNGPTTGIRSTVSPNQ